MAIVEKFTGWRLDIFDPWEMFCAFLFHSRRLRNDEPIFYQRLARRSCIFCGIASIEANSNYVILSANRAKALGWSVADVRKRSIWEKMAALHSLAPENDLKAYFSSQFSDFVEARNETAHPKRRDHAIQDFIDGFDLVSLEELIQICIVRIYSCADEQYPYWVHGWNYFNPIGEREITLINNEQFLFSLAALNFKFDIGFVPGMQGATSRYLGGERQFRAIKEFLKGDGAIVEYIDVGLPMRPILLRDWHDKRAIEGILDQLPEGIRKMRLGRQR
jgi:hypothetical protein